MGPGPARTGKPDRRAARTLGVMRPLGHRSQRAGVAAVAAVAAGAIAVLVTAAAACSSGGNPSGSGSTAATLPTTASSLPAVSLAQFKGMLATEREHGTPVLLNVWNSLCGPCIREAPALEGLAKEFAGKVQFVGLDVNDVTANARAFIAHNGWTFPSVADPRADVRNGLGYAAYPVTVLYDGRGRTVYFQAGDITVAAIRTALSKLS